jgi:hypothetical protein
VRTFAAQIKHVAASNYFLWSSLTGDTFPDDAFVFKRPAKLKPMDLTMLGKNGDQIVRLEPIS